MQNAVFKAQSDRITQEGEVFVLSKIADAIETAKILALISWRFLLPRV